MRYVLTMSSSGTIDRAVMFFGFFTLSFFQNGPYQFKVSLNFLRTTKIKRRIKLRVTLRVYELRVYVGQVLFLCLKWKYSLAWTQCKYCKTWWRRELPGDLNNPPHRSGCMIRCYNTNIMQVIITRVKTCTSIFSFLR